MRLLNSFGEKKCVGEEIGVRNIRERRNGYGGEEGWGKGGVGVLEWVGGRGGKW